MKIRGNSKWKRLFLFLVISYLILIVYCMKYYVVRKGKKTWIFTSWNEVQPLVSGFPDAKFKSFDSREDAERWFASSREKFYGQPSLSLWQKWLENKSLVVPFEVNALAVDASSLGNPGILERRGVHVATGKEVFRHKVERWTNNVGEFLALVEGITIMQDSSLVEKFQVLYSDSKIAMSWVQEGKCKSTLRVQEPDLPVWKLVAEAEQQLLMLKPIPILKWETSEWGEISADFGRK